MTASQRRGAVTCGAVLAIVLTARLTLGQVALGGRDYHPDEGVWLATSKRYFERLFLEGDFRYETWSDPRFAEFGTRTPPVGKYIVGLSLFLSGVVEPGRDIRGYDFGHGFDWDALKAERPPPAVLQAGRAPALWLGAGCVALLFLLGRELTGSVWVGLFAALFLLADPLLARSSRSVMMDVPALFFSLLALCAAARLCARIRAGAATATAGWTLAAGIACGLALSTKINALLILGVVLLWVLMSGPTRGVRTWAVLSGLLLASGAVFVATNPFLYPAPIQNTLHLLELGQLVTQYEVAPFQQLHGLPSRLEALLRVGVSTSGPVAHLIGRPTLAAWLDGPLCALGGVVCLTRTAASRHPDASSRGGAFVTAYAAVVAVGILWWTPFVWTRWYLPLEPVWALLEAVGLTAVPMAVDRLVNRLRHGATP